jgi:hypothetical protein
MTTPVGKLYTRTPTPFTTVYQHPSGLSSISAQVRLLKRAEDDSYGEYDTSSFFPRSVAPGGTISISWKEAEFEPLEWGAYYAIQWRMIDTNLVIGEWSGTGYLWLNAPPKQATDVYPEKGISTTSRPLVSFSAEDADDDPGAWFAESPYAVYNTSWSGGISAPLGVSIDPLTGNIWVADYNNTQIRQFTPTGTFVSDLDVPDRPIAVTHDTSGNIYIAMRSTISPFNVTFRKYNASLVQQWTITPGPIDVGDIASDGDRLLITDRGGSKVSTIELLPGVAPTLTFTTSAYGSFGGAEGQLNGPWGIDTDGRYYWISDAENVRIEQISRDLVYVDTIDLPYGGEEGIRGEVDSPSALTVAPNTGNIYVADSVLGVVSVWSQDGTYLGTIGTLRNQGATFGPGDINWATGLDIDDAEEYLYVSDTTSDLIGSSISVITRFRIVGDTLGDASVMCGEVEVTGSYEVPNGTFDTAISSWVTGNHGSGGFTHRLSRITDTPYAGEGAARVEVLTAPATPNAAAYVSLDLMDGANPQKYPCAEGYPYTITAWNRRSTLNYAPYIVISWYDSDNFLIDEDAGVITNSPINTWGYVVAGFTAPPNATSFSISMRISPTVKSSPGTVVVDWDEVQIGRGIRYIRPATHIGAGHFTYQMTADDMPDLDAFEIRARGRDINNPGPWSSPEIYRYVIGPAATITEPASGAVLTTTTPVVSWTLTAGEQWSFKVEAVDAVTGVIVYASDWIADPEARSYTIPPGYLADDGSYLARLWIDDGGMEVLI